MAFRDRSNDDNDFRDAWERVRDRFSDEPDSYRGDWDRAEYGPAGNRDWGRSGRSSEIERADFDYDRERAWNRGRDEWDRERR